MRKSISVIGAGGHSRTVVQLLMDEGFDVEGVYDDSFSGQDEKIVGVPLKGFVSLVPKGSECVLAIGDNYSRREYFRSLSNVMKTTVSHASAIVSSSAKLGQANLIMPRAIIGAEVIIGDDNIINSAAVIEHESVIGNHCHISVNATISGRVKIGNSCMIGAGSVIRDYISICDNVIIGAGAVVVKDISEPGTYVGNPVKRIK
mgnify:FL=1|tara:strand:- start:226 stop:834 length:609 start_codon:yes stop_codon:yes gene_type:complete